MNKTTYKFVKHLLTVTISLLSVSVLIAQPIESIQSIPWVENEHEAVGINMAHRNSIFVPELGYLAGVIQGQNLNEQGEVFIDMVTIDSVTSKVQLLSPDLQSVLQFDIRAQSDTAYWFVDNLFFDEDSERIIVFGRVGRFQNPSFFGFLSDHFFIIHLDTELNELYRNEFGFDFSDTNTHSSIINRSGNLVVSGRKTPLQNFSNIPYLAEFTLEGMFINSSQGENCQANRVTALIQNPNTGVYYDMRHSGSVRIFDEALQLISGAEECLDGIQQKAVLLEDHIFIASRGNNPSGDNFGVEVFYRYNTVNDSDDFFYYESQFPANNQFAGLRTIAAIDTENIFFGHTIREGFCPPLPCEDWSITINSVTSEGDLNWRYIFHETGYRFSASEIIVGHNNVIVYIFNRTKIEEDGSQVITPHYKLINPNGTLVNTVESLTAQINNIELFPNPAKDVLYITRDQQLEGLNIAISDVLGRPKIKTTLASEEIDIAALTPGCYFVSFYDKNKLVATRKIIVRR